MLNPLALNTRHAVSDIARKIDKDRTDGSEIHAPLSKDSICFHCSGFIRRGHHLTRLHAAETREHGM
jgi:hypothetical protein